MLNKKFYFDDKKYFIRKLKNQNINKNYLNWFKNKKNSTKFIVNSDFKNLNELKKYYKNQIKKKSIFLGIFNSFKNEHIGNIKFDKIDLNKKIANIGIFLGNINYHNKKVGSKSLIAACELIYRKFKIFKIYLGVDKKNYQAINSYKNAGFYIFKEKKNMFIMLRNYFLNKIIIGTANFENKYGVVADKKISKVEQNKIFAICNRYNISSYDLSEVYNLNFKFINDSIKKNSKIYLKILESYKHFNIKKILKLQKIFHNKDSYLMLHGLTNVIDLKNRNTKKNLYKLSQILPLGISVYSPSEIYKAFKLFKFKTIQAPVNIFDQRFLSLKMLNFFKKKNVQFCGRSIYLQGVLLQDKNFINKNFPQLNKNFANYFNYFGNNLNKKKKIITHYVFQNFNIDKVVIGFENSLQLKDLINILDNFYNLEKINFKHFRVNNLKLIDPTNW